MKSFAILAGLLLGASAASATVTLVFSSTSVLATNFANSTGVGGSTMVWGVVIDTAKDGFDFNTSGYFFNVSIAAGGQSLLDGIGAPSDDFLFISPALMNLVSGVNDGAEVGQNRITAITNIPYGSNGIDFGDAFAVVWFDRTALGGPQTGYGNTFGTVSNALFTIPSDGSTTSYTAAFAGPDPLKLMTYAFIPEPSCGVLGLLGMSGLLRRRR